MSPESKITGGRTTLLFEAKVLGRHNVKYFQCRDTGFIQTESPYWLPDAYQNAITSLDLGLVSRNIAKSELTQSVAQKLDVTNREHIDFGGGYGMFTRLMRDKGLNFTHYDSFCENLYAKECSVDALPVESTYYLATAWEVFEHIPEPRCLLSQLLACSDSILFSTELVPETPITSPDDWWYFAPEIGQHISFYTKQSIQELARQNNLFYYTNGFDNHLLTKVKLNRNPLKTGRTERISKAIKTLPIFRNFFRNKNEQESLLQQDFQTALKRLRETQTKETAIG